MILSSALPSNHLQLIQAVYRIGWKCMFFFLLYGSISRKNNWKISHSERHISLCRRRGTLHLYIFPQNFFPLETPTYETFICYETYLCRIVIKILLEILINYYYLYCGRGLA